MRASREWLEPGGAAIAYAVGCTLAVGGFADDRPWGDPELYERYAGSIVSGQLPYDDFYFEYPPGAIPAFVAPHLLEDAAGVDYVLALRLLMASCGLASLLLSYRILAGWRVPRARRVVALASMALAPVLLGQVFLNRYDAWPALLTVLALTALLARRPLGCAFALSVGTVAKVFPAVAAPVAFTRIVRRHGRRKTLAAAALFVLVGLGLTAVFLIVGFGGVAFSFYTQSTRGLHVESIGGSILLVLDSLGLYEAQFHQGLAVELSGRAADAVGLLSAVAQIRGVFLVAFLFARGRDSDGRVATGFTAAVLAYVILGKVLSPQFLVWLVPLVPLASGHAPVLRATLFALALVLTPSGSTARAIPSAWPSALGLCGC